MVERIHGEGGIFSGGNGDFRTGSLVNRYNFVYAVSRMATSLVASLETAVAGPSGENWLPWEQPLRVALRKHLF